MNYRKVIYKSFFMRRCRMSPQEQMRYNLLQGQFYVAILGKGVDEWVLKHYPEFVKIAKMYRQFPIRITMHTEIMRKIVKSM
jgi:hypothetical protein